MLEAGKDIWSMNLRGRDNIRNGRTIHKELAKGRVRRNTELKQQSSNLKIGDLATIIKGEIGQLKSCKIEEAAKC